MTPIRLPWPSKDLSPNARVHWARKNRAVRIARHDAQIACMAAGVRGLGWERANLTITFHAPDNRARDLDNMVACLKGALDGIADTTGIDDSRFTLTVSKGQPVKGGEVVVEISEVAHA